MSRFSRLVRRAAGVAPWPPGGIVLLYHRIAEPASDPQQLAVSPENFSAHLEVLTNHGMPMPLDALVDQALARTMPPRAVAVTFDDGYADVLHAGLPLLTGAGVPATAFIATGSLATGRGFWWDQLAKVVLSPGVLPERLRLSAGPDTYEWSLGAAAELSVLDCRRYAAWTVDAGVPTARHRVYLDLCQCLKHYSGEVRDQVLADLSVRAGIALDTGHSGRSLRADEIATLAAAKLMAIGSHTESHPSLPSLPATEQRREIAEARDRLQAITGGAVTAFAYPFGGPADVSPATQAILRELEVTVGCLATAGSVRSDTDRYRVPRVVVRNWSKAEFLERWNGWMAA